MAGVAFAVEGDGVGFATESYAASALYTTLASLSGALWRIRRASCFVGGICTAKISFACRILKFYAAYQHSEIDHDVGTFMSTAQAILFGMMLSWTPSLVLLSWLLWKERIGTEDV
jgi:hypothetical protein